jgi:hypothetical protein
MGEATASRRTPLRRRLVLLLMAIAISLLSCEAVLHALPGLLPAWYRERFPPYGIEFFHRGILDRTPLDTVPIPYGAPPYAGPPPHDLIDRGIAAPAEAARDRAATPRLVVPVDRDGLPNAVRAPTADLVLVGDSFLVYGAQSEPTGLVATLARGLGASTLDLGVSGTGPPQERSLLLQLGLPAKPRLVLWFFFGGNDVYDTQYHEQRLAQGLRTWGDLKTSRRAPWCIVPSLFVELFRSAELERLATSPLPGLPDASDPARLTWFHPDYTRLLALEPALLQSSIGWQRTVALLREAHAATVAQGASFLLVFVPSKEQVHLPHVRADAELLLRSANMPGNAAEFQAAALRNRELIERSLAAACVDAGIPYWTCTTVLDELAQRGDSGYYATDTHWNARGQVAVAERLLEHLRASGLWPR